jgi:transitional endoplasmic reticulum ATPase
MAIDSYNKGNEEKLLATLRELGGKQVTEQSGIRNHRETFIAKPQPMTTAQLAQIAVKAAEAENEITEFSRTFNYRPWDGANAFQLALYKAFGHAGVGKATQTMFGTQPPRRVTIEVGPNETAQVPWGEVEFTLDGASSEFGPIFYLSFRGPKRREGEVEGIFKLIEEELRTNSIYKGKAFNGAHMPSFLDPYSIDRKNVVYAKEVERSLIGLLWHPIRYTQEARNQGISLKRSILLGGPYGTGKSMAAMLTAQEAVSNGWTFIQCRPGHDDLDQVMKTAQLYQPAVVFYEDVDTIAQNGEPEAVQKLLDTFDGISAKGTEIVVVLTTNHVNRIHKGMLRPGRMDGVIEIGPMDAYAAARLMMGKLSGKIAGDLEKLEEMYPAPSWELDHFVSEGKELDPEVAAAALATLETPAFIDEALRRILLWALARPDFKATTQDVLDAVESLIPQHALYTGAGEGTTGPAMDTAFKALVSDVVKDYRVDVDNTWKLVPADD